MHHRRSIMRATATFVILCFIWASVAPVVSVRGEAHEIGTWLPSLADERVGAAYAYYEGSVVVMGGYSAGLTTTLDTVLLYDIATGETSYGASMPYGGDAFAYAQMPNGTIYLFGGHNSSVGSAMSVIQTYDPAADEWSLLSTETPVPLSVATGCLGLDGLVYIFGGWITSANSTLIYDPERDVWRYGADNPFNFWGTAAVVYSETAIYVIGGGDHDTNSPLADVSIYNPIDDSWTPVEPLPYETGFPGATMARNGYIYAFGGLPDWYINAGSEFSRILRYDIGDDTWEVSDESLSTPRSFPGVVQDEYDRIFVVGGCNGGDASATVEMFLMSETAGYASLVITSPSDGSTVSGVVVVEASLVNSFMDVLLGVDLFVNGELYESQELGLAWAFTWDTTGLPDMSTHQLLVRGYYWDASITEASITVTVSALSVDEKLDNLEGDVSELNDSLAALSAELALLAAVVDEQSLDIEALQGAISAIQSEIDNVTAELASLSGDVSDMDSEMTDRIEQLEEQLDSLDAALATLQGVLDGLQTSVDDVQSSVDNKMDGTLGLAIIGLLIVVMVLMIVMMVIGRKPKAPIPESPPEPPTD